MNSNKRKKRGIPSDKNRELDIGTLMLRCAIFTLVFCAVSAVMMLILSWLFYSSADPTSKITLASLLSLYISSFVCSFALAKVNGQKCLLGGIVFGAMLVVLTLALSLLVKDGNMKNPAIWRSLIPVVTTLAAFLGKKREGRKIKHRIPQ